MYNVDFFIKKFEAIPEENFIKFNFSDFYGRKCFAGHCMSDKTIRKLTLAGFDENNVSRLNMKNTDLVNGEFAEVYALCKLFATSPRNGSDVVFKINNGFHNRYKQKTIKQRILAALYDIKKMQQPEYKNITSEIASIPIQQDISDLVASDNALSKYETR